VRSTSEQQKVEERGQDEGACRRRSRGERGPYRGTSGRPETRVVGRLLLSSRRTVEEGRASSCLRWCESTGAREAGGRPILSVSSSSSLSSALSEFDLLQPANDDPSEPLDLQACRRSSPSSSSASGKLRPIVCSRASKYLLTMSALQQHLPLASVATFCRGRDDQPRHRPAVDSELTSHPPLPRLMRLCCLEQPWPRRSLRPKRRSADSTSRSTLQVLLLALLGTGLLRRSTSCARRPRADCRLTSCRGPPSALRNGRLPCRRQARREVSPHSTDKTAARRARLIPDWPQLPARRTIDVLDRHSVPWSCRARQVRPTDYADFDYIFAMVSLRPSDPALGQEGGVAPLGRSGDVRSQADGCRCPSLRGLAGQEQPQQPGTATEEGLKG
jgi:hypothetical protein